MEIKESRELKRTTVDKISTLFVFCKERFVSVKNKIKPTVGYRRWFFRLHPRCRVVHLSNKQNIKISLGYILLYKFYSYRSIGRFVLTFLLRIHRIKISSTISIDIFTKILSNED